MDADTLYIPKDANLADPLPGDFILVTGSSWQSWCIKIGQALWTRGDDRKYTHYTHGAIIIDEFGTMVEALNSGVKMSQLSDYQGKEYVVVSTQSDEWDRKQMVNYASRAIGRKYGWFTIFSLALSLISRLKFNFGVDGQLICSSLIAHAMFKGWDNFSGSLDNITPFDLAKYYKVEGNGQWLQ